MPLQQYDEAAGRRRRNALSVPLVRQALPRRLSSIAGTSFCLSPFPFALIENDLELVENALWHWCRVRNFGGYDPFDGLNSRVIQATPLKNSRVVRLAWTQFHKRSPI